MISALGGSKDTVLCFPAYSVFSLCRVCACVCVSERGKEKKRKRERETEVYCFNHRFLGSDADTVKMQPNATVGQHRYMLH